MNLIKIIVDVLFSIGAIINAIAFIPQLVKLYREKNSANLSLLSFLGFNFIQFGLMLHGILTHNIFLAAGMGLTLLTCGGTTILIFYYQNFKRI